MKALVGAFNQEKALVGAFSVIVQPVVEPMDRFTALFQVEHVHSKHDITCHSKSRRNKKKKIPLVTNEEVDMDLSAMDEWMTAPIVIDIDMQLYIHIYSIICISKHFVC